MLHCGPELAWLDERANTCRKIFPPRILDAYAYILRRKNEVTANEREIGVSERWQRRKGEGRLKELDIKGVRVKSRQKSDQAERNNFSKARRASFNTEYIDCCINNRLYSTKSQSYWLLHESIIAANITIIRNGGIWRRLMWYAITRLSFNEESQFLFLSFLFLCWKKKQPYQFPSSPEIEYAETFVNASLFISLFFWKR